MMMESPLRQWQGRTVRGPHETEASVAGRLREQLASLGNRLSGSLFFVPSPLEGWGLEVLAESLGDGSVVVCFEKIPELYQGFHAQAQSRFERSGRTLFWLEADTEQAVRDLCRDLPLHLLRRVEWLPISGGWLLASARYREISARLDREIKTFWSNRLTSMHLGPLWIRNLFANLQNNDVTRSWPDWGDDHVLVCGAGTSLEGWLPKIRESRETLRLLAADTALPALTSAGIIPDAVVCLESQQVNLKDFLPAAGRPIDLFCDLSAHPATTRALKGQVYWFSTPFENLLFWARLAETHAVRSLPPVGSVGVAAMALAHRLTTGSVYLAGLDFCWPMGKTHAKGSPALTGILTQGDRLRGFEQSLNWSREGTSAGPSSGWITSRVLQGYADILRNEAQTQWARTWVLGDQGLDVGLRTLLEWPQLTTRLKTAPPDPQRLTAPWNNGREVALLESVVSHIERLNNHPQDAELWEALEKQLRQTDYLFFSFPDPHIRRDSSFLSRVLILARWMRDRLVG